MIWRRRRRRLIYLLSSQQVIIKLKFIGQFLDFPSSHHYLFPVQEPEAEGAPLRHPGEQDARVCAVGFRWQGWQCRLRFEIWECQDCWNIQYRGWVKKFAIWYCSLSMLYKYNWFKTRSWCWKAMGRHHAMSCFCGIITKIFTLSLWIWIKFAFEPYWSKVLMHQPSGKLNLSSCLSKKRQRFTFFFINHAECTEPLLGFEAANLTTGVVTGFETTFIKMYRTTVRVGYV